MKHTEGCTLATFTTEKLICVLFVWQQYHTRAHISSAKLYLSIQIVTDSLQPLNSIFDQETKHKKFVTFLGLKHKPMSRAEISASLNAVKRYLCNFQK